MEIILVFIDCFDFLSFFEKIRNFPIEKVAVLKNDTIVIVQLVSLIASGPIESILTIQNKSKVTEVLRQTLFSI